MLNRAKEASDMLKKHINNGNVIRIISHNDADGISAAGLMAKAIKEEEGQFHTTLLSRLKAEDINSLHHENYELFIFCDMGSACIKQINSLKGDVIIADHHQPSDVEPKENIIHINPHLFEIDGSKDLSGAGSSYLVVRALDKKHLAYLALVGAFGDMQCQEGFTGVNKLIYDDAIESGTLEVNEGLKIASKNSEPLYKSLAYSFNPPLTGLTGDLESSQELLEKMTLSYGIKFTDLEGEEQDVLKDELIKINPDIFSNVYILPNEVPLLRDLEDFSDILDACGKNKKYGLGLSIALGEREKALVAADDLRKQYRNHLVKGLQWIKREGSVELENIQYLYSEDKIIKKVMGTIISVAMSIKLISSDKPVIGMSRLHNDIKISGRATRPLVNKGVNLGKALQDSSSNFSGQGGGHDIAAGAMIPFNSKDNFLHLLDEMVGVQVGNND